MDETLDVLENPILLGAAAISMVVTLGLLIFAGFYVFGFNHLRRFFNRMGGFNFMPYKRIGSTQKMAIWVGLGLLVVLTISSMLGKSVQYVESILLLLLLIWGIVHFFQERQRMPARAALWSSIYQVLSCFMIIGLAASIGAWVIILYAVFGFISAEGNCCGNCIHFDRKRSYCPKENKVIRYSGSECCDYHERKEDDD